MPSPPRARLQAYRTEADLGVVNAPGALQHRPNRRMNEQQRDTDHEYRLLIVPAWSLLHRSECHMSAREESGLPQTRSNTTAVGVRTAPKRLTLKSYMETTQKRDQAPLLVQGREISHANRPLLCTCSRAPRSSRAVALGSCPLRSPYRPKHHPWSGESTALARS